MTDESKTNDLARKLEAFATLVERAGLRLTSEEFDRIFAAWGHVSKILNRLPRNWPRQNEPSNVFIVKKDGA
jgi:hypothetical protein